MNRRSLLAAALAMVATPVAMVLPIPRKGHALAAAVDADGGYLVPEHLVDSVRQMVESDKTLWVGETIKINMIGPTSSREAMAMFNHDLEKFFRTCLADASARD